MGGLNKPHRQLACAPLLSALRDCRDLSARAMCFCLHPFESVAPCRHPRLSSVAPCLDDFARRSTFAASAALSCTCWALVLCNCRDLNEHAGDAVQLTPTSCIHLNSTEG